MSSVEELKNYFKKLKRIVNYEEEFVFFDLKLIKKSKIDDLLCCILATFPEKYKKFMNMPMGRDLKSVACYRQLFDSIKRKFILSSDVYLVEYKTADRMIETILATIDSDISYIEKLD